MGSNYQRMMSNWDLSTDMVSENGLFTIGACNHTMEVITTRIHDPGRYKKNLLYVKLIKEENPYYFSEDELKYNPKIYHGLGK